jgi:hypothetical protein
MNQKEYEFIMLIALYDNKRTTPTMVFFWILLFMSVPDETKSKTLSENKSFIKRDCTAFSEGAAKEKRNNFEIWE